MDLDPREVRAWRGWHHHMAARLMGLWFLVRERRRVGKESGAFVSDGVHVDSKERRAGMGDSP